MFLHKSHIWEKSGSWKTLGQSECLIFTSTMSPKQNHEKTWFFLHLYKFMKISWIELFSVGIVKSGCCFSGIGFYLFINDLPKWRVFKYSRIANILVLPSWPVRSSYFIVFPELSGNPTVPARLNWFFVCSSFISGSNSINHHHAVGPVRFSLNWSGLS